MLSRPASKLTLTPDDISAFEARQSAREAMKRQDMERSQTSSPNTVENAGDHDSTPATLTRAAKAKAIREQRLGLGGGPSQT